ncbi:2-C-methyl-D-erythritol 4-phosphate cytidylyltransferase [Aliivibrio sp. S4TY2]|uniref:2-C-methyl-D-erythritol 4-phosphate cytidylyltransferase n=1 Tax=unclassified Aliivibrio TaxID=2645654 RepID=UPI002378688C|nr:MULTISPECIES: 2-C-methyl-D-erythritol 4-phosphate cytidylyltransferase [unclassified Aliivibrio]MDD9155013.1 2-C-methyl-D-erythritol 4-phosphate cytidylyltransferase [Aliivibrio sp. S4TY2]MDD9158624.1 2-C-methyl-D-erythritol 4-phosphate cytidylyltransferase [Aliivibrio sp. S4TY1]MDD9163016.1 2-C-methyl-D-erythritol 4-phosphate cytidylyltransferase [Aliivibrio sp. S4MY2]MDD9166623.1 2-C-methyl-D-erythritol 4-phosphate cytidylyltransferase [Aliivibrio sp. S4MY4]MDD9184093.1 2-C-methyl-D-eryth
MTSTKPSSIVAIVPAAGVGSRMKADRPKQYLVLNGKTVLEHTIEQLLSYPLIENVVVAITDGDPYFPELAIAQDSRVIRVSGGKERADSVLSGLLYIKENQLTEWVMVHDAARPCIRHSDIEKLIGDVIPEHVGGILATPVRDTMKQANTDTTIEKTIDRSVLWHALTPQLFTTELLYLALKTGLDKGLSITDESSAIELMGYQPKLVQGRADNLKITQPEDLDLAAFYLQKMKKETKE